MNRKRFKKSAYPQKSTRSIASELRIFEIYECYEDISPAHKAWITIKAKQRGLNSIMVHAGIKAKFIKFENEHKSRKVYCPAIGGYCNG